MTEREMKILVDAFDTLQASADREDGCCDDDCTIERPCCDGMRAKRARLEIDRLLTPKPESLHPERLTNPAERVFFEKWQRENERSHGLNGNMTTLEWVMCPSSQKHPDPVSERDMQVATAVVQWLGTACGLGFLSECESEIRKERAEFSILSREAFEERFNGEKHERREDVKKWAHWIASRFKSVARPDFVSLEELLIVAVHRAFDAGRRDAARENQQQRNDYILS